MRLKYPVVLASASPRRQELLRELVDSFEVVPADLDEDALSDDDPFVTAQRLAREKAMHVFDQRPEALVIAGDTVVAIEENGAWTQLVKPVDVEDAVRILTHLQGRTHTVVTGIALRWPRGMEAFTDHAQVTFRSVSETEIREYIATGEPMDKAGAYGIQGMASTFLERLEGDIQTVVGLPVQRLKEALHGVK